MTVIYIINRRNKLYDGEKKSKKPINKLAFWKLRAELLGSSMEGGEGSLLAIHY